MIKDKLEVVDNEQMNSTPSTLVTPAQERRNVPLAPSSGSRTSVSHPLLASENAVSCACTGRDPISTSEDLICSICLSPMAPQKAITNNSDFDDEEYDQMLLVETSCKHQFHHGCLASAKLASHGNVSTCPLCRACLSPSAASRTSRMGDSLRQAVINSAHRGRQAVRMALESRRLAAVMT